MSSLHGRFRNCGQVPSYVQYIITSKLLLHMMRRLWPLYYTKQAITRWVLAMRTGGHLYQNGAILMRLIRFITVCYFIVTL